MASAGVSELILFIAAVSIAAGVSGAMVTTVSDISGSIQERGADISSDIGTDIEIINDPADGVYNASSEEITLLVKNTGQRTIVAESSTIEVLIDGRYVSTSKYTVTVLDGNTWHDGTVARIAVNKSLTSGDHDASVIVRSEQEKLRFRT